MLHAVPAITTSQAAEMEREEREHISILRKTSDGLHTPLPLQPIIHGHISYKSGWKILVYSLLRAAMHPSNNKGFYYNRRKREWIWGNNQQTQP